MTPLSRTISTHPALIAIIALSAVATEAHPLNNHPLLRRATDVRSTVDVFKILIPTLVAVAFVGAIAFNIWKCHRRGYTFPLLYRHQHGMRQALVVDPPSTRMTGPQPGVTPYLPGWEPGAGAGVGAGGGMTGIGHGGSGPAWGGIGRERTASTEWIQEPPMYPSPTHGPRSATMAMPMTETRGLVQSQAGPRAGSSGGTERVAESQSRLEPPPRYEETPIVRTL